MATLQDQFVKRQQESANQIGNLYDQQHNAQAASLKTAYDKNMSDAQAEQAKIAPQFRTQGNQMATAYERNRRNLNLSNMISGMGSGTALQQQDALNRTYQQNYAGLMGQQAAAQTEAAQKITDLGTAYRNQLNEARMDAENKKAAALVTDQNQQNDWYDQQAKMLAQYGDFSAYENLYGTDAANQMKQVWIIQNPEAALGAGLISKKRYKKITGHDAGTR